MATLDKEIQILMLKGQKGDTGRSIESIIKTSSSGDIDTYTITYTDGTTSTFEIENGVSSQDLQNALSPITSDITDLQNDKLNNSWQGEEVYENNSILNNAVGIKFILNGNEQYAEALHQPHQIKFNVESYNHGDNENTYQTNIIVSDRDIVINKDLGDGNESYSLFDMAKKKLYRHIITYKGSWLGWSFQITFEVINNVETQYINFTALTHFNLGGYLNCIGYVLENNQGNYTEYPILYAKLLTHTIGSSTFNHSIDLYYKDLSTHRQITSSEVDTLYDEVITIEL